VPADWSIVVRQHPQESDLGGQGHIRFHCIHVSRGGQAQAQSPLGIV
jgi:hypothetical protein